MYVLILLFETEKNITYYVLDNKKFIGIFLEQDI